MIKNSFRNERDYTISLEYLRENNRKGILNRNELSMTRNAFKLACLSAGTSVSKQIYQFLIDLEKHVHAFMKYENEYLTEQVLRV